MIGVLHFINNYRFPNNSRNTPQYKWTSLNNDDQKEYLVASSNKYNRNQYVIIEHKCDGNPRPIGTIIRIIGEIDDKKAEIEARLYYRKIAFKKWKCNPLPIDTLIQSTILHRDCRDIEIYSIDPEGCKDIDDAFSYQDKENRMGIHIADVSYIMQENGMMNIENFKNRYSSVYLPNQVNHMISESLSTNQASLLPNESRFTWSLWLDLSETNEIIKWNFERTIIKSCRAFSYEEADKNERIMEISKRIREIGLKMLNMKYDEWTTHEMIEVLMIIINHLAAIYISENGKDKKMIYRIHGKSTKIREMKNDKELDKFLNIMNSQSAEYTYDNGNYYHHGLQINRYTHFSSPIRRYVDLYVHMIMSNIINPTYGKKVETMEVEIERVNEYNRNVKKFQRDMDKIELISMIKENNNKLVEQGYIIDINVGNKVDVYFPRGRIMFSFMIINKNIIDLFKINNNENDIEITYENKMIKIEKCKLMEFNLYAQMDEIYLSKKIICEIPILSDFIKSQHK